MAPAQFHLQPVAGPDPGLPTTVELHGDVDMANAAEFDEAVAALMRSGPTVLDLSPTDYVDSAGFAALDRLLGQGRLRLVMAPTCVIRRAASIVGLPFTDDVDSARADLARHCQ
jgi:anti-sigma B factor antagonist